ncbi:hypothetical protein DFH07DRAFT_848076 [Mycena maculata]|uniref:Uncharacterized protein n=1 Tax=Mycena maculata TaxID=230809 RepID=A0AAD7HY24_9AGAR|nr:hypothetical protein DFH07DRAFT_847997 [Mycena maculata]KAJ7731007.1 hypothetical protein DFH07DRAFT_848076 [Mycena maculata]
MKSAILTYILRSCLATTTRLHVNKVRTDQIHVTEATATRTTRMSRDTTGKSARRVHFDRRSIATKDDQVQIPCTRSTVFCYLPTTIHK